MFSHGMVHFFHISPEPTGQGMAGWMDDLRFYVLFNSISVISGR